MNSADSDWEGQRAFLAVLETGSLSAAARRLGLAQPTVRRRIEALEAQVGAALFTRTPTGLAATPAAEPLGEHVRAMAAAAEAFTRTASAEAQAEAGTVRITASEIVAVEVLPAILAALQARHPALQIELGASNRNEDLLRREADIAVRMSPPRQEALLVRRIGDIRLGLFAHRRLVERFGVPETMEDLGGWPAVGFEHPPAYLDRMVATGFRFAMADFSFRSDSDLAQLAAIRAGVGAGVCQIQLGRRCPDLVPLLVDQVRYPLETWVVMHEDLKGLRRMRLVFDALVEGMAAYCREA